MSEQFTSQVHDTGIAEVVISRPPVNALNCAGWNALAARIAAHGEDPAVRVIVVRAEGRGFCAGVDIKELDAHPELIVQVNAGNYATFKAVHRNPVPVIPLALQGLWGSFFSRKDGAAMSKPFRRGLFSKIAVAGAPAVSPEAATPEHLQSVVQTLRGDWR